MFNSTKQQIKFWKNNNIHADFKVIDKDNAEVYSLRFKDMNKEQAETWLSTNFSEENFRIKIKNKIVVAEHYEIDDTRVSDAGYTYGVEHVIRNKNGISIRLLVEPSEEYKAVLEARRQVEEQRMQEEEARRSEERLIQDKMRELAIDKLKEEGKL